MENRQLQIYEAHVSRTVVQPFVAGHARRILLVDSLRVNKKKKKKTNDEVGCTTTVVSKKKNSNQFVIEHTVRMWNASHVGAVQGVQIPGVHAQMRLPLDVLGIVDGEADLRAKDAERAAVSVAAKN